MGTGNFSFAAWVKFTTAANVALMLYGDPIAAGLGYGLKTASTGIVAQIGDGVQNPQVGGINSFNNNTWHLCIFVATRAGNGVLTIDNNTEQSSSIAAATGSVNNTHGFAIGGQYDGTILLDGSMDEVGLWNRVLTGAELTALWNSGNGVTYPF
jgi:hypothetical protein